MGFVLHEAGYWARCRDWNFPNVFSPFWRIYYDLDPGHWVRFGDTLTPLGPKHVLVIPNHRRFDCVGDPPVRSLWLVISCEREADPWQSMPIVIEANDTIRAFAKEFARLTATRRPDGRERIRGLSLAFGMYVLHRPEIRWREPVPEWILRVIASVDQDLRRRWTTTTMAEQAGMSADGFARAFRRSMGRTPAEYLREVRIREACRLLRGTEESIERISHQIGLRNRHHFTRVFGRVTGTTPARYRRNEKS
jgi:AraC-like DNA-binding protein